LEKKISKEKKSQNTLGLSHHGEESLSSWVKYGEQWLGWQEEEGENCVYMEASL
jgi:hypothetical protein